LRPAAGSRDERSLGHDERSPFDAPRRPDYARAVDVVLGVLLGVALVASVAAGSRLLASPRPVLSPQGAAMRSALHAVTSTLPHLRQGLDTETAQAAAPHLRAVVGSAALAIADRDVLLAYDGAGSDHHRCGDAATPLFASPHADRVHVDPSWPCGEATCPLGVAVAAPLHAGDRHVGTLVALHRADRRLSPEDTQVVQDAAMLVGAQLALAELDAQGARLAEAELRALRAQISPHFIYNALAAIASQIHADPDEARELLTEFAEFTRYAFRGHRPYVTLADELRYVEKYLRLEQARFGDRLAIRIEVAPEVLPAVVPVLSVQPLVENAVRHGVEVHGDAGHLEILGRDLGPDVELRVNDDGPGIAEDLARSVLAGDLVGGGIGLSNVDGRMRAAFGPDYGLRIESRPGAGTSVVMTVPKFRAGVRAS